MKKRLLPLFILAIISFSLQAQYRCIPSIQQHGNPGGMELNDIQFVSANWYNGPNVADTPGWKGNYSIGFPFSFNGAPVSRFRVSNNGILTFDTATGLLPARGTVALPSSRIPDRSVCITGFVPIKNKATVVVSQQTNYSLPVPAQQCWISFINMADSGVTSEYVWSIVLEQTTNNIYLVDQVKFTNGNLQLAPGIQINSTTAYSVPGSPHIIPHTEGTTQYSCDNYYYAFLPGNALTSDGAVLNSDLPSYLGINHGPFTVRAKFKNLGTDTVRSLQVHYTIDNGAAVSQSFSGLSIPLGFTQDFVFSTPFAPSGAGTYTLDTWADNLSSGADAFTGNDHFTQTIYVAATLPTRRVMCEEIKATWCSNSGYWTPKYDSLLNVNKTKTTNVHFEQQGMAWDNGMQTRQNLYNDGDIPTVYVNGKLLDYPGNNPPYYPSYLGNPWNLTQGLVDSLSQLPGLFYADPFLSITDDSVVHVTGTMTAAISLPPTANCRYYMTLVEDTINHSYITGQSGETIWFNTSRVMLPGVNGVFIGHPAAGTIDTFNFTYTIRDTTCHPTRLHAVLFVQDTLTLEMYQSAESDYRVLTGIQPVQANGNTITLYPNPAYGLLNITSGEYSLQKIELLNSLGQSVYTESPDNTKETQINVLSLQAGFYLARITAGDKTQVRSFVIDR